MAALGDVTWVTAEPQTAGEFIVGPPPDLSPQPPIFFLSYAHSKYPQGPIGGFREQNPHVLRLFDTLSEHVSEMVPHPSGSDPGFVDRSMGGGERWNLELLAAAGSCQVFVALVSWPYVTSDWCGMEWDAFARRPVKRKVPEARMNGTMILPVIWSPPTVALPKAVRDVQWFVPSHLPNPDIAAQYQREGLYGLLSLRSSSFDAYEAIAWRLAQRIVELLGLYYVEPQIPMGTEELVNVFQDGAENNA